MQGSHFSLTFAPNIDFLPEFERKEARLLRRSQQYFLILANSLALFPLFRSCRNGIVANLVFVTILAFFPSITKCSIVVIIECRSTPRKGSASTTENNIPPTHDDILVNVVLIPTIART